MKNRLLLSICLFFTALTTVFSQTGTPLPPVADLKITFTRGKPYASPGEKMDMEVSVFQINGKNIQQEVRVDLVIVSNRNYKIPAPIAVYAPVFSEGVLLAGGRSFWNIPATGFSTKMLAGSLPADLPPGKYFLAVVVDAGNRTTEWDENNNVDYFAIEVQGTSIQPSPVVFKRFQDVLNQFEVYMAGTSKGEGQIFIAHETENLLYGNASPVYEPKASMSSAIAFSPNEEVFFVDASQNNIYRSDGNTEEKLFTHQTSVKDIAFDHEGNLFFSEVSGPNDDGIIYKFNMATKLPTKYLTVPRSSTGGFWTGDFAFSPSNQLFVAAAAALYKYENGKFERVYTNPNGHIGGFFFLNPSEILFSDHGKSLFFLRNFSEKSQALEVKSIDQIADVWLLNKPVVAKETINVTFEDGDDMWPFTTVFIKGPNLYWRRKEEGYTSSLSNTGTARFTDLPKGKYWVKTDIRADLGWGFRPKQHIVSCSGQMVKVGFRKPVAGKDY